MRRNYKLERLENGETFVTRERGSSMCPIGLVLALLPSQKLINNTKV